MFLTRFYLNKQRRDARRFLGSPQVMHAGVLASFLPDNEAGAEGRVLWRLDNAAARPTLYIVSPGRPDLTHLVEQVGWPTAATWETRDYQPVLDGLAAGQRWGFRLTANPTKSTKLSDQAGRSQRYGHVTADQQQAWLTDRLPKLGVSLAKTTAGDVELELRDRAVRRFTRQGATVTLTTVTFQGVLSIDDPESLRAALVAGVGPAKAYGCGLMTLARI